MDIVGITKTEQEQIFIVLAAILHLGNVAFLGDDKAKLKDGESLTVVYVFYDLWRHCGIVFAASHPT